MTRTRTKTTEPGPTLKTRTPVPITGMPGALDYVTVMQQREFEESLLTRPVTSFPISMLIAWLASNEWNPPLGCYVEGHGFVKYTEEATDELIMGAHLHTGITYHPGLWNEKCGILAIDWEHSRVLMGPDESIYFGDMTLGEFDKLIEDHDRFHLYYIPGTDRSYDAHGVYWDKWYPTPKRGAVISPDLFIDMDETIDKDRPWYLLPSEYEELLRRRAAIRTEDKEAAMPRMAGMFYFSSFERHSPWGQPTYTLNRVDKVSLVNSSDAWKDLETHADAHGYGLAKEEKFVIPLKSRRLEYGLPPEKQRCGDKKLVRIDTLSVTFDTPCSARAWNERYYMRIKDWIPFDSPEISRRGTLPREHMDYDYPIFSVTPKMVKTFISSLRKWDPNRGIAAKYKCLREAIRELDGYKPKPFDEKEAAQGVTSGFIHEKQEDVRRDTFFTEDWDREAGLYRDERARTRFIKKFFVGQAGEIIRRNEFGRISTVHPVKRENVNSAVALLRKKFVGKWTWWDGEIPFRVDAVFAAESEDTTNVRNALGKDYIVPVIVFSGRLADIEHDTDTNKFKVISCTDIFLKKHVHLDIPEKVFDELGDDIRVTTLKKILDTVDGTCSAIMGLRKDSYDAFVDGVKQLLDGKNPEFYICTRDISPNCFGTE